MRRVTTIMIFVLFPTIIFGQNKSETISLLEPSFSINKFDLNQRAFIPDTIVSELFVDTNSIEELVINHISFPRQKDEFGNETIGLKNIEFYKVTICNVSPIIKTLTTEDSKLVLVQEALDTNGNWTPIEYFFHSDCAMSFEEIELFENQCVLGFVAKYSGNYKTELRIKLKFDEQIIYSNTFNGSINTSQFHSVNVNNFYEFR